MSYGRSVSRGPSSLSAKNFSITTGKPTNTRRAYQQDIHDFMIFAGLREPE